MFWLIAVMDFHTKQIPFAAIRTESMSPWTNIRTESMSPWTNIRNIFGVFIKRLKSIKRYVISFDHKKCPLHILIALITFVPIGCIFV